MAVITFDSKNKDSIRYIKGIGPKRAEILNRLGILTIRDLCYFFPRTYEDRSQFLPINTVTPGSQVTIRGTVLGTSVRPTRNMTLCEMVIHDKTGSITAVWFNQPYLSNKFKQGDQVILSGKAEFYQRRIQLSNPEHEIIQQGDDETVHTGRITPIYPLTEGLFQRALRTVMKEVSDHYVAREVREFMPLTIHNNLNLMDLHQALKTIHFPETFQLLEEARKRLVFDEFFLFQLSLLSKIKASQTEGSGLPIKKNIKLLSEFKQKLPFELTTEQEKVIDEIMKPLSQSIPMNRLLQGDVGSGKTVVASFFLFLAAQSKIQSALLVPTEILAEQHFHNLSPLFQKLGISSVLLTGGLSEENKVAARKKIKTGGVQIVIGTHALLQDDVSFTQLGLVIIDEQHRFGVEQRAKLLLRKPRPHLLVMTATPIPRTLGLTLYGDLDISTIETLPKGRKEIKTYWIRSEKEPDVLEYINERIINGGDQAYVLYPIIEENEKLDLLAAKKEYERLKNGPFKKLKVGLVHGRIQKKERDEVMKDFYANKIRVLVATSVIEVGVDNPNVTCMVIENAERFGLAQLHQMRGRIGRGTKESVCFLFGSPETEEGKKRLRILTKTTNGFEIAEQDLLLRGPGDFLGTQQSGIPFFNLADFSKDQELLLLARQEALKLLESDPKLSKQEHQLLLTEIEMREKHAAALP